MHANRAFRPRFLTLRLGVALLFALLLTGCAPRVHYLVWHPAEIDIQGLERLAIIDFEGEQQSGRIARSALQAQLFENKYYQLVDQAELARVRPVLRPDGSPDLTAALDAARILHVDVLLCGQVVSYNVADDLQTEHHVEIGGGASKSNAGSESSSVGLGLDSTQTLTREASVSLAVKLIDVRTGEIKAARQFAHAFNGKRVNGEGELPGRESILTKLLTECAQDSVQMIAPHYRKQEIALARSIYGKGMSEIREGNKLATSGNWHEAEQKWQAAVRANPQSHVAHYNLALAAELRQDFPAAQQHLNTAIKQYADVDYQKYKAKLQQHERKFQAALAQAQSRPTVIAARQPRPPQQPFVPQPQFVQQPMGPPPGFVQQPYPPPQHPVYAQQPPPQFAPPAGLPPGHLPPQPPFQPQVMPASHQAPR